MKVNVLIENTSNEKELEKEHGMSLYIVNGKRKILMDTGSSGKFIGNAERMHIDLKSVDMLVLSHGHRDHGGGLLEFLKTNEKAKVYMKKEALGDFYTKVAGHKSYIGLDKRIFEKYLDRIVFLYNFSMLDKNIFAVTDIKRPYPEPLGNRYLYMKGEKRLLRDKFQHELVLAVREEDGSGITIFTGCSHSGILNIIDTVKKNFAGEHIKAVIGGFHYMGNPILNFSTLHNDELARIKHVFEKENIDYIYTGHCTGEKAYNKLKDTFGEKVRSLSTGVRIAI